MIWIVAIMGGILILILVDNQLAKEKKTAEAEFEKLAKNRVDAYIAYIRRTSSANAKLSCMSDLELQDLIYQKTRSYKRKSNNLDYYFNSLLYAGFIGGLIHGLSVDALKPFLSWLLLSAGSGVVIKKYLSENLDAEFREAGFDPKRLKIEK